MSTEGRQPLYEDSSVRIYCGDVREVLRELPDESVHCVVTSPPYWGLRDYGCPGQIGLEETPKEYVDVMAALFLDVQRVLRDDGTLWLNMGDCYATGAGAVGECPGGGDRGDKWKGYRGTRQSGKHEYISAAQGPMTQPNMMPLPGLKPKDLCGVPWRLAFALQSSGWYLRSDIIWSKPNPMPESVTDRPTKAHEYIFLLSKSERYFYDQEAIAEASMSDQKYKTPDGWDTTSGNGGHGSFHKEGRENGHTGYQRKDRTRHNGRPIQTGLAEQSNHHGPFVSRNKRTVWTVTTESFPEAHFATFPQDLIKPCILAGCPEGGTVLDPFMGSGTTGLVAKALHCKAIGIELNPAYIEIAARRLSQETLQFNHEQTVSGQGPERG